MTTTRNYTFEVSLTTKCFDHKPDSAEIRNLMFTRTSSTIGEFCDSIVNGYGYVGIFNVPKTFSMHDKSSSNFSHSWFVSIDIDHSRIDMQDMFTGMRYQPTIAYTSCSNGLEGDCRFRLVYLFDEPTEARRNTVTRSSPYCTQTASGLATLTRRALRCSNTSTATVLVI